jgi:hypothetical protein
VLFRQVDLERIRDGELTAAVRRWRRPTVRAGGTLVTPIGVLSIDEVRVLTDEAELTEADLAAAGFASVDQLRDEPALRRDGRLHLIRFHLSGADPRIELREQDDLGPEELSQLEARLRRMDERAADGPWTRATLAMIADQPGVRAADLAAAVQRDRAAFKADVRKLKGLGLTESLEVGYRLSPRGRRLLDELSRPGSAPG